MHKTFLIIRISSWQWARFTAPGRESRGVSRGVVELPTATRVATNVACKINCVTDQKAKAKREGKSKKKERKKTYFLLGQTKVRLVKGGSCLHRRRRRSSVHLQGGCGEGPQCPQDMQLTCIGNPPENKYNRGAHTHTHIEIAHFSGFPNCPVPFTYPPASTSSLQSLSNQFLKRFYRNQFRTAHT